LALAERRAAFGMAIAIAESEDVAVISMRYPMMNTLCSIAIRVFRLLPMLLLIGFGAAHAESFPARPLKLVVPFSPGGISDFLARVIAEGMQPHIGAPMIVENRPGAGGNIGMDIVAKSPADGHVMGLASVSFASNSVLQSRMPFDPLKDFTPIVMVGFVPSVIVVHPSLPAHNLKEFIDLAKKRPDELAFGSSGMGTGSHLAVELFKMATGTRMTHIPYKSTAQAVPDLLAGRLQFMFDFPTTAIQPIRAGKDYEFATWFGILTPDGVPAPVVGKLSGELLKALESPGAKARMAQQGIEISPMQSQQFGAFLRADIARWKKMLSLGHLAKLD
jgi:tripartite-type tricarboxylate transporter receptor subunit TctC